MTRLMVPDFPAGLDWMNSEPLSLERELKGKVVVLDFWTYGCINCMHVVPDLAYLERKYAELPVVFIGVHSPKFSNEQRTEQIRRAMMRYEIHHPVVSDPKMELWQLLGLRSWPTILVLGPGGVLIDAFTGEGRTEEIDAAIQRTLDTFPPASFDLKRVPLKLEEPGDKTLLFPGKIAIDGGGRLLVSDSNHNQIVIMRETGEIETRIGSGEAGLQDGGYGEATFYRPQGLLFSDGRLFVADTQNHALREIDLETRRVRTLSGNGAQGVDRQGGRRGRAQALSSPWDLALYEGVIYIAMAGTHQVWGYSLASGSAYAIIGNGMEMLYDGDTLEESCLAQPSGLCVGDENLYIADSESSSIRGVDLARNIIETLVGGDPADPRNLFAFGDRDGVGSGARLQHPLGVAWWKERSCVVVADTYNHKIKLLAPKERRVSAWVGSGVAGHQDGPLGEASFFEPSGVCLSADGSKLYITDTNNHALRMVDVERGVVSTVQVRE